VVSEVRDAIRNVVTAEVVFPACGFGPRAHHVVSDAFGESIVIEYVGGRLQVHGNPLGVMSNSPSFDWHRTNLRNCMNLSVNPHPPGKVGAMTLTPLGHRSGMLGIPGDFAPPSRFVRVVAYSTSILPPANGAEAVLEAFHILNNVTCPRGLPAMGATMRRETSRATTHSGPASAIFEPGSFSSGPTTTASCDRLS
jgi:choloylglycine hydrolase